MIEEVKPFRYMLAALLYYIRIEKLEKFSKIDGTLVYKTTVIKYIKIRLL